MLLEPDDEVETIDEAKIRYQVAMHAVQSGVSAKAGLDPTDLTPKHLRTGVNSALMAQAALTQILIDKGIITEAEWFTSLANVMENEVKLYEQILSNITGADITLE